MVIQIDGVGTVNKGAELMLFAILQEIERKHPDATVFFNDASFLGDSQNKDYFKGISVKITKPYYTKPFFVGFLKRFHVYGIAERISPCVDITHFLQRFCGTRANVLLSAEGFKYSDQFDLTSRKALQLRNYLRKFKKRGAKIVFMPQAFGPLQKQETVDFINAIRENADLIFAREKVSYDYMKDAGVASPPLYYYPDFTSLVDGVVPEKYKELKDYVCLIPNMQMVNNGITTRDKYVKFWKHLIDFLQANNHKVFLLNHEGKGDEQLVREISKMTGILYVDKLNAVETKGVISQSALVVSSRFHGVANALSSCVPCLATSWSHKYQLLLEEYGQQDCVLDVNEPILAERKIVEKLENEINSQIRAQLSESLAEINQRCREMWSKIWKLYEK